MFWGPIRTDFFSCTYIAEESDPEYCRDPEYRQMQ